ncbi:hypothetical protein EMEDMD4_170065 [Sinorhizobium medicae]|uniref:Uncharacterized protein n=1 Tax=Sinorhizobium medicae TaxID=110321 RepID=A0A508WSW3_9HYPH|nr:hypothetical protein EMEDMD4_170065 [Sinorhizobium medicae]
MIVEAYAYPREWRRLNSCKCESAMRKSLSSSPLASRAQRIGTTLTAAVPIRKGREPTRAENRAQLKLVHNMDHCQT